MTLVEACEPLFQYVCGLSRAAAKGAKLKADTVRKRVKRILEEVRESCAESQTLARQFEEMELPLIFFVDFTISENPSRFAKEWKSLAFDRDELAGDDKFFKMLDETLGDPSADGKAKLAVYHTCLGLGFTGIYAGDPHSDRLRQIRDDVARQVLGKKGAAPLRLTPATYDSVDQSDLIEGSGRRLLAMIILILGMIAVLVVINYFQFKWESDETLKSVKTILARSGSEAATAGAGGEGKAGGGGPK
jgi:type IV/VI secretion system ImpK/VasF family protein